SRPGLRRKHRSCRISVNQSPGNCSYGFLRSDEAILRLPATGRSSVLLSAVSTQSAPAFSADQSKAFIHSIKHQIPLVYAGIASALLVGGDNQGKLARIRRT